MRHNKPERLITQLISSSTVRLYTCLIAQMMSSLSDVFQCILRVFVAPPSRFDSERRERHAYPHVEEVLLLFGTSAQSPTIVYVSTQQGGSSWCERNSCDLFRG